MPGVGGGPNNSGAIPAIEITKENTDRNDMYASDDSDYQESTSDRRASNTVPVNNSGGGVVVDTSQVMGSGQYQHQPHSHHQQQVSEAKQHG